MANPQLTKACNGCSWDKEVLLQKLLQLASTLCLWQKQHPSPNISGSCYLRMTWNTLGHHFEPCSLEQSTQVMCLKGVKKHGTTSNQHGKSRQMHRECMANPQLTNACNGCSWGKEVLINNCFNWPQPLACDRNKILQQSVQALLISVCHFKDTWDRGWPETHLDTRALVISVCHFKDTWDRGWPETHLDTTSNHAPWNSQPKSCAWRVSRNTVQPQNKHGKSRQTHRKCMANPQLTKACNGCSWGKEVLLNNCFNWPQPLACDRNKILQQSVQALLISVCHFKDTWDRGWPETHLDTTSNHAPWNSQPKSCAWRVSRNTAQPQNKHGKSKQMHDKSWQIHNWQKHAMAALGAKRYCSKIASTGLNLLRVPGKKSFNKVCRPYLSQYAILRTPETVDDLKHTWTPLRTMPLGTVNPSHVPEGCQETQYNLKTSMANQGKCIANAWQSTIDKSMQWLLLGQRGVAQKLLQLASASCVWQEQNPSTKCAGPTYLRMPF